MPKTKAPVPKATHENRASRPHQPKATTPKPRTLNWANLTSQIDAVASSVVSHSAFAQVHDPHTLVARYYLRALLEKLKHTGDMVYTGQQSGTVEVRLIVGSDGKLQALEIDGYDGVSGLTHVARHIVELSAPFAPFPASLLHKTQRLKLDIHMEFLGYHDVNAQ